jgi:hypothetical protein
MKSSRMFSLVLAAVALCSAAVVSTYRQAVEVAVSSYRTIQRVVFFGFELAAGTKANTARTVLPFVQAKAFVLRIIKRDRPIVSNDWRMCPST